MAYMSQDRKKELVKLAKPILEKHGIKASFGVYHGSTIVCTIKAGPLDFIGNCNKNVAEHAKLRGELFYPAEDYIDVNVYHYKSQFSGECRDFLEELILALNTGNWDKSDIQTDYFNVGWYVDVNIGKWKKPYELVKPKKGKTVRVVAYVNASIEGKSLTEAMSVFKKWQTKFGKEFDNLRLETEYVYSTEDEPVGYLHLVGEVK